MSTFVDEFLNNAPAPAGHNGPPAPTLEEKLAEAAADLLQQRNGSYVKPMDIWLSRQALADDDMEETATNFIARANGLAGDFIKLHKIHKQPFLDDGRTVDAFFADCRAPLEKASTHVRNLLSAYKAKKLAEARAEQARLAEEARKATEAAKTVEQMSEAAELAVAAAAPVQPVRAYTGGGAMSSMTITYEAEVTDFEQLPRQFLSYDERKVKAWLAGLPKGTVPPAQPGLKFNETVKSIVRSR